jgi:CubicO group peptidase (beta-lactamase class C family)
MRHEVIREAIRAQSSEAVRSGVFPGCVVAVAYRAGDRMVLPSGRLSYAADAMGVTEDTVYDLASVTKSIPTSSLALTLIREGRLRLDDRVSSYVPELRSDYGATIEDLLRYRVQGIALSKLRVATFEEVRAHALERGFDGLPGAYAYTNLPAFILGIALARITGRSIAASAQQEFFDPLGMRATTFFPSASDCAPTEIVDQANGRGPASVKTSACKEVRGLPHDESAYKFAVARRSVGHAGLFSTASDLLHFLEALLQGKYQHVTEGARSGLGWQTEGDFLGSHASPKSFGKTGFTGTSVAVDIEKGLAWVILSNRTYPKRPSDNSAINGFRAAIADILLQK